jgi:hypothetical protein
MIVTLADLTNHHDQLALYVNEPWFQSFSTTSLPSASPSVSSKSMHSHPVRALRHHFGLGEADRLVPGAMVLVTHVRRKMTGSMRLILQATPDTLLLPCPPCPTPPTDASVASSSADSSSSSSVHTRPPFPLPSPRVSSLGQQSIAQRPVIDLRLHRISVTVRQVVSAKFTLRYNQHFTCQQQFCFCVLIQFSCFQLTFLQVWCLRCALSFFISFSWQIRLHLATTSILSVVILVYNS